jgi:hypothetical protein
MGMLYAAIDIHKRVFQAAVLDPGSGEIAEARFPATREALQEWAMPLQGTVAAVDDLSRRQLRQAHPSALCP